MEVQLAHPGVEPRVQARALGSTTIEVRLRNGRSLMVAASFDASPAGLGGSGGVTLGLPSLHTLDHAQGARIWFAAEATDMRCGFDRLALAKS